MEGSPIFSQALEALRAVTLAEGNRSNISQASQGSALLCSVRRGPVTSSEHLQPEARIAMSTVGSHTTESRISEPSRTRGRGHTGDTSTKLSWMLSGLFSDSVKTRGPGELSDRAW